MTEIRCTVTEMQYHVTEIQCTVAKIRCTVTEMQYDVTEIQCTVMWQKYNALCCNLQVLVTVEKLELDWQQTINFVT